MHGKIDAHHHFWRIRPTFNYEWLNTPALAPIARDFLPSDLKPLVRSAGVDRTVLVQTQHDVRENDWLLGIADACPFVAGVVGWVDLASPDCERQLLAVRDHPKFVGVRHVTQDEPDDDFIIREDVLQGLKVLERHQVPFDLLFHVRHLRHVPKLAETLPSLPMVIDHLAKPRIKEHAIADWLPDFRAAARYPNVFCKLSGMVTEADWTSWKSDDLRPYVGRALDEFGADRLMFGSDWPVSNLAATYEEVIDGLVDALGPISPSEHEQIFSGTAARFYGLGG
ncbi:MAG: amidohydrolase [Isosphaeraceae bacterium]